MISGKRPGQRLNGSRPRWFFLLSSVVALFVPAHLPAVVQGDTELLRLTAMAHKDNVERIRTWRGAARIDVAYEDEKGVTLDEKNSATFVYDSEQGATRWQWVVEERRNRQDGQLVPVTPQRISLEDGRLLPVADAREVSNEMKKGDAFYHCWPGVTTRAGEKKNTLVILPASEARKGAYSYSFDPMWYLTHRGHDLTERLMFYYREAANPDLTPGTIKRQGDLVILETQGGGVVNRYTFDLAQGGNLVNYYAEASEGVENCDWSYEYQRGAWVPKAVSLLLDLHYEDGSVWKRARTISFADNVVNIPVDPSEFSLEKLGVTPGVRVTDQRMGISYVYGYGEEKAVELPDVGSMLEEFPAGQVQPEPRDALSAQEDTGSPGETMGKRTAERSLKGNRYPLIIGGAAAFVLLGLIAAFLARTRRRRA